VSKSQAESQITAEADVCMIVQDLHDEPDPEAAGDNVPPMKKTKGLGAICTSNSQRKEVTVNQDAVQKEVHLGT